ncbi:DEAD/DEAH box helicase [Desulfosarcina widdelii]|nr:DEAD/DEAH box helicase [Desulfosarcina widdelii]
MQTEISNTTHLIGAPSRVVSQIKERLTFVNPKWLENDRMGRWNGETSRVLKCYDIDDDGCLLAPRGFTGQLLAMLKKDGISPSLIDNTRELDAVDFQFQGSLRPFQERAVADILPRRFSTLAAPTGSGKTVMALYLIAERRQPALVVVHTKELLNQWIDRAEQFLDIPAEEIGIIGAGKRTIGNRITIATVQSLYKCSQDVYPYIGHLLVDECHRAPSRTFTEAVTAFDCRYMLGLSATPWRRDKLSKLIFYYLGDVHHQVDKAELQNAGHIMRAQVTTRETNFIPYCDPSTEYSAMLRELTADYERNRLIAADVASQIGNGVALVLSDRKEHCRSLASILDKHHGIEAAVLTGDVPAKQREEIVQMINRGDVKVLVATGQLIGEGFDCKHLSTLFLATPIRFSGRLLQYVGRVLRPDAGKAAPKVFDYVDVNVGPLIAAAKARQRVYQNEAA